MSMGQPHRVDANESATTSGSDIHDSGGTPRPDLQDVTLGTLGLFLIGNRAAIQRVANAPAATWLALSSVILAGLFRDYDQADLLRYPGWLLVPLLASTLLTAFLFLFLKSIPDVRSCSIPNGFQFRRLLTCFWMTAPMAIIYAIPVERFLSPPDATRWNLIFLALVATWRVLLITRVVQVLYGLAFFRALFPVMLLADSLALAVMILIPIPIIQFMGGIRVSESSEIINGARLIVILLGATTWLIWFFGLVALMFGTRRTGTGPEWTPPSAAVRKGPWAAVGCGFAAMLIACGFTQPEQQRASKFRSLLLSGHSAQAIEYLSQFDRDRLPPHWDAPPRIDYLEQNPRRFGILAAIAANDQTSDWVREIYTQKLLNLRGTMLGHQQFWYRLNVEDIQDLIQFLTAFPELLPKFDQGGPGGDHFREDRGSIRALVAELIENDFKLPGSQQQLSRQQVQQLLALDDPHNERSCGTREDVEKRLDQLSNPQTEQPPLANP
ncbi:hypothetical protein SH661x_004310 [Planctomicrobium sp. SH661]|uniref:hypothetical protein n=1 Tax=Planctomicrobium sp. SH661 TaxID=3448124 RepID=UPI003F5C69F4